MNNFIPKVRLRKHQRPKWISADLKHQLNCLKSLRKRLRKSATELNALKLQEAESNVQESIYNAKSNFEANLVRDYAGKKNYNIFKHIRNVANISAIPKTMFFDSLTAKSAGEQAILFNKFFHSVFTKSDFNLPPIENFEISVPNPIDEIHFSEQEVYSVLSSLDPSKATGPDGIGPRVLKFCALALCNPLHHLFSLCFTKHYIPKDWCIHNITPIFKAGDKSSVKNYRPISLLCSSSLVLERLIYNKISDYVFKLISPSQFGFRPNNSTPQQLLLFLSDIFNSFEAKRRIDAVYIDFKKAFDSVPHQELLLKLWSYGITGSLWLWFRAYLSSRLQKVTINHCSSDLLPVVSGVPQGSILGPILFLLFVNDIPDCLSTSKLLLFADDAKCFHLIKSLDDVCLLQLDLDSLVAWSKKWKLHFNSSKCLAISFSKKQESAEQVYKLCNSEVVHKDNLRDLGVILSRDLSWSAHYNAITSKAYKTLGLIRRCFNRNIPYFAKKNLYISLVLSQITYCSVIWRPHLIKDIKLLESVQRRATKFILNDFTSDYKSRLIKLNLLPLMMFYELCDIIFYIKSVKSPNTNFNINDFIFVKNSITRSSSHKLIHSISSTSHVNHFYFNRLPRLWNSLPIIPLSLSVHIIKQKLKKFFFDHFLANFDSNNTCSYHFLCPCFKCSATPPSPCFYNL